MSLRLTILEYIKNMEEKGKDATLFRMAENLELDYSTVAEGVEVLKEIGSVTVYKGGLFELTQKGREELKQLKGEY